MMRMHPFTALLTASILMFGGLVAFPAWSQDPSTKPIGKIISGKGEFSVEHTGAVIVQAALSAPNAKAKIGDPIYLGDIVQTGADGRLGITFTDGTAFDLSSNAHMEMTEFVYDPNSKSNSTLLSLTKGRIHFRRRQDCQDR